MSVRPLVLVFCAFAWISAAAQSVSDVMQNGDPANRIDIVIVGDGYTAAQSAQFNSDANRLIAGFFSAESFGDYKSYFNVHTLFLASVESGASHRETTPPIVRNNAFGSSFGCNGVARALCANFSKVTSTVSAALPAAQHDYILIMVNDSTYGGVGSFGGGISMFSINVQMIEIALHEFAHTHALLGDEYFNDGSACTVYEPFYGNITSQTDRSLIKWRHWIEPNTVVPTTGSLLSVAGLYEGALFCATRMYRPTYLSKMRDLGYPFEQANNEQLVKRMYNIVSTIDAASPAAATLTAKVGDKLPFGITPLQPLQHSLDVSWLVDDSPTASGTTFTLDARALAVGSHTVQAVVRDKSNWVRNDPENLTTDTRSWQVVVFAPEITTTQLSVQPAETAFGQAVTLTATVKGPSGAVNVPTGSVAFREGTTVIGSAAVNPAGIATLTISSLAVGNHSAVVVYAGDSNFDSSTSPPASVRIVGLATTTTLAAPAQLNAGESASFAIDIKSNVTTTYTPSGTVTLRDGTRIVGSAALSSAGLAQFTTASLTAGVRNLVVEYSGDTVFVGSSSVPFAITVIGVTAALTVAASASQANIDEAVTLTARFNATNSTVSATTNAITPSGMVVFRDGAAEVGTSTIANGVATLILASLAIGEHSITAAYDGDAIFQRAASPATGVTITRPDFDVAATSNMLSVQAGMSGQLSLLLTPNGTRSQTVTLSCDQLPTGVACAFSPSSVTLTGNSAIVSLTVSTSAAVAMQWNDHLPSGGAAISLASFGVIPLLRLMDSRRIRNRRRPRLANLWTLLILVPLGLVACGAGGSDDSAGPQIAAGPGPGATPVSTVITVSATTDGAYAISHTTTLNIAITH